MKPDAAEGHLAGDDCVAALACFRKTAAALVNGVPPLRPTLPPVAGLLTASRRALALPDDAGPDTARAFFRDNFVAEPVGSPGEAFLTGYYEPEVDGALQPGDGFTAPLLGRPADLVTLTAGEPRPDHLSPFSAAKRMSDGTLRAYPDRDAIEAEAMQGGGRPVVWLRDWVECFLVHVQGSARVRLPDGRRLRLTYAGRNGHPYTSIGRLLIEGGAIDPSLMSLARLKAWLRANGQGPGDAGRALMARNRSFIFFEAVPDIRAADGPLAGAGATLTPLRSIAVDRTRWCYGLPFVVDATIPWARPDATLFRRLVVAQDTGSAIVGPARLDLFLGSGAEAGARAGDIRHGGTLVLLRPVDRP